MSVSQLMNPFNQLPLLVKRMNEIIEIHAIEWLTTDDDGTINYSVTATIADMVEVRPAICHPADSAEPAELGPAQCIAVFGLDPDEPQPPMMGSHYDQVQFLDSLGLDWQIDND